MGTRADFYVGEGKDAEWIGSVAWDGYQWGERIDDGDHDAITAATTEQEYRDAVKAMLESRDDATFPHHGWPWPWEDSRTTDCAYCFADGKVKAFSWGAPWVKEDAPQNEWPDMSDKMNAVMGGARSGLIVITGGPR